MAKTGTTQEEGEGEENEKKNECEQKPDLKP